MQGQMQAQSLVKSWEKHRPSGMAGGAVYLDYAATTPIDPFVVKAMTHHLENTYGNAASRTHLFGQNAEKSIENAREQVAMLINADPSEIIWTSGATESINLAIKGVAHANSDRGKHIVTSSWEHKAVLDSCAQLQREGFEITYIKPDSTGMILPETVVKEIRDDTILVSLMHVNNEVGTITDVSAISETTRNRGIAFHVDASQSVARLGIDTKTIQADLISFSGHKIYGPKGVGVLYLRRHPRIQIEPQMHGGDQEQGVRSGTLPTHQIVGMGEAAHLACKYRERDRYAIAEMDSYLLKGIKEIEGAFVNGNEEHRIAGILNTGFPCVDNESLMMSLKDVAISSGSACTSSSIGPSHVLRALRLSDDLSGCSVRISLGRFTAEDDVDFAVGRIKNSIATLRQLSSKWMPLEQKQPTRKIASQSMDMAT